VTGSRTLLNGKPEVLRKPVQGSCLLRYTFGQLEVPRSYMDRGANWRQTAEISQAFDVTQWLGSTRSCGTLI